MSHSILHLQSQPFRQSVVKCTPVILLEPDLTSPLTPNGPSEEKPIRNNVFPDLNHCASHVFCVRTTL